MGASQPRYLPPYAAVTASNCSRSLVRAPGVGTTCTIAVSTQEPSGAERTVQEKPSLLSGSAAWRAEVSLSNTRWPRTGWGSLSRDPCSLSSSRRSRSSGFGGLRLSRGGLRVIRGRNRPRQSMDRQPSRFPGGTLPSLVPLPRLRRVLARLRGGEFFWPRLVSHSRRYRSSAPAARVRGRRLKSERRAV